MKTQVSLGSLLLSIVMLLGATALAPLACSSSSNACDSSKCAAGNKCINPGTPGATTKCELICAAQTDCPFNYHCGSTVDGSTNYCQADAVTYTKQPAGQWGAPCDPTKGLDNNSDCDTSQQFWCYGRNPTDDQAFCTQYQCAKDSDCGEDYVCQTINTFPNVQLATRQPLDPKAGTYAVGVTTTVCLPRTYCEPCTSDIDCVGPPGVTASCVAGTDGVKFCTVPCQNDGNCAQDAACDTANGVCKPRAGVCKGDGTLCSPCHADTDCAAGGTCAIEQYSGERYCTAKSTSPCSVSNPGCAGATAFCTTVGEASDGTAVYGCTDANSTTCDPSANVTHFGCPTTTVNNDSVTCTIDNSDTDIPQDQCVGLITFGTGQNQGSIEGCWTKSAAP